MPWSFCSVDKLSKSRISLRDLWQVWSNISLMAQYDKDVAEAHLEEGANPAVGVPLYITMMNNSSPKKCTITEWKPPNGEDSRSVGLKFEYCVPLGKLEFQYSANFDSDNDLLTVSVGTEITGLLGPLYASLFTDNIKEGCNHMVKSVPELAFRLRQEPAKCEEDEDACEPNRDD